MRGKTEVDPSINSARPWAIAGTLASASAASSETVSERLILRTCEAPLIGGQAPGAGGLRRARGVSIALPPGGVNDRFPSGENLDNTRDGFVNRHCFRARAL